MTWHVPAELLIQYDQGRLDTGLVLAVDAHLVRCATCRAVVPAEPAWLAASWDGILDAVDAGRVAWPVRLLVRCGVPEHRIRLLAATPVLRRSWVVAMLGVLAFAVIAAQFADGGLAVTGFLAVAPLLPLLAVASAYGARVDSMHEVTAATPMAGPALMLWRSIVVLSMAIGVGLAAALLLPGSGWYATAWLLPALGLGIGSLTLATAMPLQHAAAVLGGSWLAAVLTVSITAQSHLLFGPDAQAGYLTAASAAVAVLIVRRRRLDPGAPR